MFVRAVLLSAVLAIPASSVHAFCRMKTSTTAAAPGTCQTEGEDLVWTRGCISYSIDRRSSKDLTFPEVQTIVAASVNTWLEALCDGVTIDLQIQETSEASDCNIAQFNQNGPNINNITFVTDWTEAPRRYDPNAFALTTVWHSVRTGEIFDADLEINENRGKPYTVCPDTTGCQDGSSVDLQNVVTHELGHVLGIAHSSDRLATMAAASPPGEIMKRILSSDDVAAVCEIYPPGTLTGSCDFEPRGGLQLTCDPAGTGGSGGGCSVSSASLGYGSAVLFVVTAILLGWRRR